MKPKSKWGWMVGIICIGLTAASMFAAAQAVQSTPKSSKKNTGAHKPAARSHK